MTLRAPRVHGHKLKCLLWRACSPWNPAFQARETYGMAAGLLQIDNTQWN